MGIKAVINETTVGLDGALILEDTNQYSLVGVKDSIIKEIEHIKQGNIPTIQGLILLLLAFILFSKGVKLIKTLTVIILVTFLLLYVNGLRL